MVNFLYRGQCLHITGAKLPQGNWSNDASRCFAISMHNHMHCMEDIAPAPLFVRTDLQTKYLCYEHRNFFFIG